MNPQSDERPKANGSASAVQGDDLDQRILQMEQAVGTSFYRNILREYGRVNQPKLIRDVAIKQKVWRCWSRLLAGSTVWKPC